MGLFDFLFGRKKLTMEEADAIGDQFAPKNAPPMSEQAQTRLAIKLMTSRKYQESIDAYQALMVQFPESKATFLSQIGVGHYFLGDYPKAIEYYVAARDNGEHADIMDHNIWEACETIFKNTGDKAAVERYLVLCPGGSNTKAANKLLAR